MLWLQARIVNCSSVLVAVSCMPVTLAMAYSDLGSTPVSSVATLAPQHVQHQQI